jgi:hypothetical protein
MAARRRKIRWSDLRAHTRWLALAAVADFVVFYAVTLAIGGDGLSGQAQNGHYFVANHGRLTEASPAAWWFTRIQAVSLFVLWPLALLSAAVDSLRAPPPDEDEDHSILGRKDAPPRRAPPRRR